MSINGVARGLAFSVVILAAFAIIDDFVLTLASDLTNSTNLKSAFQATLIWFCAAFVGAYFARQRVELIAVSLVLIYWCVIAVYRFSAMSSATDISFIEFVYNGLPSIVPSIASCWVGAFLGWKYRNGADKPNTRLSRRNRTLIIAVIAFLVLVVTPIAFSQYWNALAVEEVRIAVRAIELGNTPDNVAPFEGIIIDLTPHVENLLLELTSSTKFRPDYKMGEGFHSYQVEILPDSGSRYTAIATYHDWSGWRIYCCLKED